MAEKEIKEEVKKVKERYSVVEVATATAPIIHDNKENKQYTELTFLAKLGNDIEQIKTALG